LKVVGLEVLMTVLRFHTESSETLLSALSHKHLTLPTFKSLDWNPAAPFQFSVAPRVHHGELERFPSWEHAFSFTEKLLLHTVSDFSIASFENSHSKHWKINGGAGVLGLLLFNQKEFILPTKVRSKVAEVTRLLPVPRGQRSSTEHLGHTQPCLADGQSSFIPILFLPNDSMLLCSWDRTAPKYDQGKEENGNKMKM
jgi:hypothetical protein